MTYSVNLRLIITQCLEPQDKNGQERVEMGVDLVSRRRGSDLVAAGAIAGDHLDAGRRRRGWYRRWVSRRRAQEVRVSSSMG